MHYFTATFATLVYGGALFATTVLSLMLLRRMGVLRKYGLENAVGRVVKAGLVIWLIVLGVNLRNDVLYAQALAQQSTCMGHMKGWAHCLHSYLDEHGQFPSTTIQVNGHEHSWRVLVYQYLETNQIKDRYNFDEPWNSEENQEFETDLLRGYAHCTEIDDHVDRFMTSFVAITGPECVLRDDSYPPRRFEDLDPEAVLFVETKRTDIHWMAPEDLSYERLIADRDYAESVLGGPHLSGGYYATVDGRIRRISNIGIDELLRRCVVLAPAEHAEAD